MKWPKTLTLIRHDESAYNRLKVEREKDPLYQKFLQSFESSFGSKRSQILARKVVDKFNLGMGDHDTPLADNVGWQSVEMAKKLQRQIKLPDVVFVSPYLRTRQTFEKMTEGWKALKKVKVVWEERIREQDHGITILYNDWKIFVTLNPLQQFLRKKQGTYWYRFPQGESVADVRERLRSWLSTLIRDFANKNVLAVTHHLAILSIRANLERLSEEEFLRLDKEEKPINCGVSMYVGDEKVGENGKLILKSYNQKLHEYPGEVLEKTRKRTVEL